MWASGRFFPWRKYVHNPERQGKGQGQRGRVKLTLRGCGRLYVAKFRL